MNLYDEILHGTEGSKSKGFLGMVFSLRSNHKFSDLFILIVMLDYTTGSLMNCEVVIDRK